MEANFELISLIMNIALPIFILLLAYFIGSFIEKKHFKNLRERETENRAYPVVSFDTMPDDCRVSRSDLVSGSIVVSLDYFKRVIAGLRGLIGGRVKTYESIVKNEPIEEPGVPASFRVLVKELQSLGLAVEAVTESGDFVRFGKEDDKRQRRWVGTGLMDLARSHR